MPDSHNISARTLLAQHAKTTELLGVDFLPLGTPPAQIHSGIEKIAEDLSVQERQDHRPPSRSAAHADSMVESKPLPNFAPTPPAEQAGTSVRPAPSGSAALGPIPDPDIESIKASYQSASDQASQLHALQAKYESDAPHQFFNTSFTNIVFGEGDANADLMFIGEAPGEHEDETGRPFVGRAGELLEKMIVAMGLSRELVYIANVLKTRPPNNATPTREESLACAPYLYEQIRIVNPKYIVTLGLPATHLLLDSTQPMKSMRGSFHDFPARDSGIDLPSIPVMPTYHPAYLLRAYTEDNRRKVWSDLTQVMQGLGLS
ncbi:MAG: uracil-DNA glycosylase [Phycisphaerales bacterium]